VPLVIDRRERSGFDPGGGDTIDTFWSFRRHTAHTVSRHTGIMAGSHCGTGHDFNPPPGDRT